MDFLSNASYSGYRNHIQKDILQENVKFGQINHHLSIKYQIKYHNHVIFQFFFFNKSAKMSTILCFSVNMGVLCVH